MKMRARFSSDWWLGVNLISMAVMLYAPLAWLRKSLAWLTPASDGSNLGWLGEILLISLALVVYPFWIGTVIRNGIQRIRKLLSEAQEEAPVSSSAVFH